MVIGRFVGGTPRNTRPACVPCDDPAQHRGVADPHRLVDVDGLVGHRLHPHADVVGERGTAAEVAVCGVADDVLGHDLLDDAQVRIPPDLLDEPQVLGFDVRAHR